MKGVTLGDRWAKGKSFYIPYNEHMLKLFRIKIKDKRGINDRTS